MNQKYLGKSFRETSETISYRKFTFLIHAGVSEWFYKKNLLRPVDHTYLLKENSKSNQLCTFMEQKLVLHVSTLHKQTFNCKLDGHKCVKG